MVKALIKTQGKVSNMALTIEQRLRDMERSNAVLRDTLKLLHKLLKEQRQLIKDYILQKVAAGNGNGNHNGENNRPEDEIYTFVCLRRFNKLDRDIRKIRKLMEKSS